MIPKRVYLRAKELEEQFMCERMVSCNAAIGSCNVEYTDLSQLWHDACEEPKENSKIVIVDSKGDWWNIDYVSDDFDGCGLYGWEFCIAHYNLKKWAYIIDLLPKGGDE